MKVIEALKGVLILFQQLMTQSKEITSMEGDANKTLQGTGARSLTKGIYHPINIHA